MITDVHGVFFGVMEFQPCGKILHQDRDYSMVSDLEEETGTSMDQSLCEDDDLSHNLTINNSVVSLLC